MAHAAAGSGQAPGIATAIGGRRSAPTSAAAARIPCARRRGRRCTELACGADEGQVRCPSRWSGSEDDVHPCGLCRARRHWRDAGCRARHLERRPRQRRVDSPRRRRAVRRRTRAPARPHRRTLPDSRQIGALVRPWWRLGPARARASTARDGQRRSPATSVQSHATGAAVRAWRAARPPPNDRRALCLGRLAHSRHECRPQISLLRSWGAPPPPPPGRAR